MPRYEAIAPILRVEDMSRARHFYVNMLGFQEAPWGTDDFTFMNSGNSGIYVCRGDQGRGGAWIWIGTDNARLLHDELLSRGVKILMPPTNFPWAIEFHVEDPDGNTLRIGSDPDQRATA
jgi:predicted enzyme related to lactoylglutathione lyase